MNKFVGILFLIGWVLIGIKELLVNKEKEIKLSKFHFFCLWLVALIALFDIFNF